MIIRTLTVEVPDKIEVTPMRGVAYHPVILAKAQMVLDVFTDDAIIIGHAIIGKLLIIVIPDTLCTNMTHVTDFLWQRSGSMETCYMNVQGNIRTYVVNLGLLR